MDFPDDLSDILWLVAIAACVLGIFLSDYLSLGKVEPRKRLTRGPNRTPV